ncbi:hypothetical protein BH09BAC1_BH09BAC1_03200 [soil metagenome]
MKNAYGWLATTAIALSLFIACAENTNEKGDAQLLPTEETSYTEDETAALGLANEASMTAQQQLVEMLVHALEDSGTAKAVVFCNIHVGGIYDSIKANFGIDVKRVSHKPRNPANAPTERELKLIEEYSVSSKQNAFPIFDDGDHYTAYRPIRMSILACSKCHGIPGEDIEETTLITLSMLYPDDKATGFKYKDLRGLWRVEVPKTKTQEL